MDYRASCRALMRLGVLFIICGGLTVLFQITAILLVQDQYMYVTVLRNYHVIVAGSGIWAGACTLITGILGVVSHGQLRRRARLRGTADPSVPCSLATFSGLTVLSAVLILGMLSVCSYTLWLLVTVLHQRLGFYKPTYRLYVILLIALYALMLLTGLISLLAHIVGSVVACRLVTRGASAADRGGVGWTRSMQQRSAPLLVYQNDYTPPTSGIRPHNQHAATARSSLGR